MELIIGDLIAVSMDQQRRSGFDWTKPTDQMSPSRPSSARNVARHFLNKVHFFIFSIFILQFSSLMRISIRFETVSHCGWVLRKRRRVPLRRCRLIQKRNAPD